MNDTPLDDAKGRTRHRVWFWLGCLALLAVFVLLALNFSGKSAWDNYRRQWEAKGERFDFASFIPKPVPDDRNFALTPIVASSYNHILDQNGHHLRPENTNVVNRLQFEIYGENRLVEMPTNGSGNWARKTTSDLKVWQNYYRALAAKTNQFPIPPQPSTSPAADVLLALGQYDSALEELRTASHLPDSRFPLNYEADPPAGILLPHLAVLKKCSQMLRLRTLAEQQSGQNDKALADVKLSLRLIDSIRTEPFLISHLVRIAMLQITLQPVWEGLVEHKWSDAQLADLGRELAKLDFLADYEFSMRGERALAIAYVEHLRRKRDFQELMNVDSFGDDEANSNHEDVSRQLSQIAFHLVPNSIFYRNELTIARLQQQYILPIADVERRIVSPTTAWQLEKEMNGELDHFSINTIYAKLLLPGLAPSIKKFACAQSSVDLARVACALERCRLAQGNYPESLDALSPQFLEKMPHDLINGQPLHYRRTEAGTFLLYSVGWNEKDDGGQAAFFTKNGRPDNSNGDWIWPGAAERSE